MGGGAPVTTMAAELDGARRKLLDLTLRNRLLHYRPSALRSIRVTGELPSEIYDAIVLREKTLEFRGTGARKKSAAIDPDATGNGPVHRQFETWTMRDAASLDAKHTDRFLQTPYDDESLAKKLFRVYHEGRSAVEEQGYTVAHLALGFLEWFESEDSDEPRRAPLILVPAELERVRAGEFSKVKWTGEDVFANISLQAKLVEYGVTLPAFEAPEEKSGIDAWLQQVVDAIAKKPRWRVLSELTLDFFSFTKFVMFKDLDPATWPSDRKPEHHPLLQTLFARGETPNEPAFDESRIDGDHTARDFWHVMDADPSQIAVIEEAKSGRNLVVEGPPGTGKSQTITNLIAETLAAGRTVLFVSEKMAALDVVRSRLELAGLGPFCLELHSRKANKKAVLQELKRALGSKPLASPGEELLDEHELLKRDLNRYAFELRVPVGGYGRTPYQLFGMREVALAALGDNPELPRIDDAAGASESDVVRAESALRELAYVLPNVQPVEAHPWRTSAREAMLPDEEDDVRAALLHASDAVRAMRDASARLAHVAGVRVVSRAGDLDTVLNAAELMASAEAPAEAVLLLSAEWNAPNEQAEGLVQRVEEFQRDRATLAATFHDVALEGRHASDVSELAMRSTKFFRFFDGRYRSLKHQLSALFAGAAPKVPAMCAELARLVELQARRDALRAHARGPALFGARWKGDRSDCAALRRFAAWLVAFRRELLASAFTQHAVSIADRTLDAAAIRDAMQQTRLAASALRDALDRARDVLRVENSFESETLDDIDAALREWQQQIPLLFPWVQFNAARRAVANTVAAPLLPLVTSDCFDPKRLLPLFRAALAESLLRFAFRERPALGQFVGDVHEKKVARFRELDAQLVLLNRARLSRRLHAMRPQISGGATPASEAGILLGEMNRTRGHMSIRKLLARAGGLVQRIKPCFLMSPLSVAQFLDPRSARFDLIVFDEASQVRPEDAVGALLRGSQLVVMGDTKQLPPTSFFDHLAGDDGDTDEDESAALKDVESILHQCARSYPTQMLEWHYRSRHESLIAISNLHFYDRKLRVYPSAIDRADALGLHFVHVPHAVYERGRTAGVNRVEAQVVAAAALDQFRRDPKKTLGIGTFNIKQQQAILEEIELLLRREPQMEAVLKELREPFFVKNLETIQGDERDTILISLGFGKDADGKLSMNFGPLNREGGERRLNVLISRARERCVVYSNFTAADLPVDATTAKGVFALREFLAYAETRQMRLAESVDDADRAPFEEAVAAVLRAHGYEVRMRVGRGVDIGVLDPEEPGRYLLGIACDGKEYHSATVARDRDRLREQILTNLGWTIHRVWVMDWYRNRAETISRLVKAIEDAKHAPRSVAPVPIAAVHESASADSSQVAVVETTEAAASDIAPYETCTSLRIAVRDELHLVATSDLAIAVEDVVAVEGPVHIDEVARRIRSIWGLQRTGSRIREAIERAIFVAVSARCVVREGEFLSMPDAAVRVRRRDGDPPPRIELIADSEIAASVQHVLETQFATPRAELIDAAVRRFGIQSTSAATAERVSEVVDAMIRRGAVMVDGQLIRRMPSVAVSM
jgi:hypothetical protein